MVEKKYFSWPNDVILMTGKTQNLSSFVVLIDNNNLETMKLILNNITLEGQCLFCYSVE